MMIHYLKQIRDLWYKHVIWHKYKIGKNFHCGRNTFLWAKNKIEIGNNFYLGRNSCIETDCVIGDNVIIANNVGIIGRYDHNFQQVGTPVRLAMQIRDTNYNWKGKNELTIIGNDIWIGYGSIILSGVNIANGTIIASGSVVTHDTEEYCIYAGVPAKKIRQRFNTIEDLNQHLKILQKTT